VQVLLQYCSRRTHLCVVCVCVCVREGERKSERETERVFVRE
jgi:hypothetical protein